MLESRIQRLHLVKQNTNRHRNIHALYKIHHGDVQIQTGSRPSYKLGYEQGRDAIPASIPRFSRRPSQVEHCPTPKFSRVVDKSTVRCLNRKYV